MCYYPKNVPKRVRQELLPLFWSVESVCGLFHITYNPQRVRCFRSCHFGEDGKRLFGTGWGYFRDDGNPLARSRKQVIHLRHEVLSTGCLLPNFCLFFMCLVSNHPCQVFRGADIDIGFCRYLDALNI